jgi:hypothetical protein
VRHAHARIIGDILGHGEGPSGRRQRYGSGRTCAGQVGGRSERLAQPPDAFEGVTPAAVSGRLAGVKGVTRVEMGVAVSCPWSCGIPRAAMGWTPVSGRHGPCPTPIGL